VGLIDDLLDLTHIAKGTVRLELERVDLHEVIRLAVTNLENQQASKAIWLKLQLDARRPHIRADAGKLEQALSNLIGNAVKFTSDGGRKSRSSLPTMTVTGSSSRSAIPGLASLRRPWSEFFCPSNEAIPPSIRVSGASASDFPSRAA
jgi:nitrogen-specific signal transduction histidine kinase